MIVLSFDADTARRIVNGEQTVVTYPGVDGLITFLRMDDGRMVALPDLVGQSVAIARLVQSVSRWPSSPLVTPGAIVGSATVAAVVPTYGPRSPDEPRDIIGLEYVDLTPGRWAVILTDAAPCEDNCVVCLARGWIGAHARHGDPIPYDHPGPIGEWTP